MARFLTIGEFSRRTGVSVSALRFYDRVGVLVPADVDPSSSYRRYADAQVPAGALVRDLRRLEMPLAQITTYLAAGSDERRRLLDAHVAATAERLASVRAVAEALRAALGPRDPDQEDPPPMSNATATVSVSVDAASFAAAIDQVAPAASTDREFPLLQTVLVEARDGTLRVVATDRYRLAVRDLVAGPGGTGEGFRALVAAAALVRVRSTVLQDRAPGATVTVARSEHALVVGDDPSIGSMPVMAAEFPDYEKLLVAADDDARAAVVERAVLQDLLETVADEAVMRLSFGSGRLVLDGDRSIPATFDADEPPPAVGLHPAFVRAAVDAAVGPEVLIDVTAPERPVVFRSATDGSYVCMVMPIKLRAGA